MSKKNYSKNDLNNHSNQLNPNNNAYYKSRGLNGIPKDVNLVQVKNTYSKDDLNNHSNQLNPNNNAYYKSRGLNGIPKDDIDYSSSDTEFNIEEKPVINTKTKDNIDYSSSDTEFDDEEIRLKKVKENINNSNKVYIYNFKLYLDSIMSKKNYVNQDIEPVYNIPKLNYKKSKELSHDPLLVSDFILYKFSISKIKKDFEKKTNVKIEFIRGNSDIMEFTRVKGSSDIMVRGSPRYHIIVRSNKMKNLDERKEIIILINNELERLIDQELKYNKIVDKIKKYYDYPYMFLTNEDLDNHSKYGDCSFLCDYIWTEGGNLKKYFKYNNLSAIKKQSENVVDYGERDKVYYGEYNNLVDYGEYDFCLGLSEIIENYFINKIENVYDMNTIREKLIIFNSPKNCFGELFHREFVCKFNYSAYDSSKERKKNNKLVKIFQNFLKDIFPSFMLYIKKDGTLNLINILNHKIIYEYKLPEKYSKKKITNICLLENDNILIELDKILLLEFNIITSELKSFLYESKEKIVSYSETKIKNIDIILKNDNLNYTDKIEQIKIIVN